MKKIDAKELADKVEEIVAQEYMRASGSQENQKWLSIFELLGFDFEFTKKVITNSRCFKLVKNHLLGVVIEELKDQAARRD